VTDLFQFRLVGVPPVDGVPVGSTQLALVGGPMHRIRMVIPDWADTVEVFKVNAAKTGIECKGTYDVIANIGLWMGWFTERSAAESISA